MNKDRIFDPPFDKGERAGLLDMSELTEEEIEFLNRPGTQEALNVHQGWKIDKKERAGLLDMSELTEEEIEFLNRPGTQEVLNVHQGWKVDTE